MLSQVQTDKCASFAKGIRDVNNEYGYEKLELMFRGQNDRNPQVRPAECEMPLGNVASERPRK